MSFGFSVRTFIAGAIFSTVSATLANAQTVEIPSAVKSQIARAHKLRDAFDQNESRKNELQEAIRVGRQLVALTKELQYLPTDEVRSKVEEAIQSGPYQEPDYGGPFERGRDERLELRRHGIDADKYVADFDRALFKLALKQINNVLLASDNKKANVALEGVSRLEAYIDQIPKEPRPRTQVMDSPSEDDIKELRRLYRVFLTSLVESTNMETPSDTSVNQTSGRWNFRNAGRAALHLTIMEIEDECVNINNWNTEFQDLNGNPKDFSGFHHSAARYFIHKLDELAKSPGFKSPEELQQELSARRLILAQLAFLDSTSLPSRESTQNQFIDWSETLRKIANSSDARQVHQSLTESVRAWEAERKSIQYPTELKKNWQATMIDLPQLWNRFRFNRKATFNGKPITVELWTKPPGETFERNNGPVGRGGGRRRGQISTGLTSRRPTNNPLLWKVTYGDSGFYLTLAAPASLNARHANDLLDVSILEYVDYTKYSNNRSEINRLDARLAVPVKAANGIGVLVGTDYRPGFVNHKDFVPTFATVQCGDYPLGFVVIQIEPGAGDLDLAGILAALLSR